MAGQARRVPESSPSQVVLYQQLSTNEYGNCRVLSHDCRATLCENARQFFRRTTNDSPSRFICSNDPINRSEPSGMSDDDDLEYLSPDNVAALRGRDWLFSFQSLLDPLGAGGGGPDPSAVRRRQADSYLPLAHHSCSGVKTSTESINVRDSVGRSAPTPTTWRDTSSPRSLRIDITMEYSHA